jgi:uncharacterized protein YggU (UPF0235/DUF167 family)
MQANNDAGSPVTAAVPKANDWRRVVAKGIALAVRLTPRGGANIVEGLTATPAGMVLKVRVKAAPEKGRANAELETVLARWLELPSSSIQVSGGHKSRTKTVLISGVPAMLLMLLDGKIAETS